MKKDCEIILASASPRRKELLSAAGVPFSVHTADIDESVNEFYTPKEAVMRLAERKALAVYKQYKKDEKKIVIGADTLVSLGNILLGKPEDTQHAQDMLEALSDRTHQVRTGVCIIFPSGQRLTFCECTDVTFRELEPEEIAEYIASGEPMDKAGAYGIQGGAAKFVSEIKGDYDNVVGLPVKRTVALLKRFGAI